jgi:glutathione synthase/RimK-type ligase-like ATP-grasp enzyme
VKRTKVKIQIQPASQYADERVIMLSEILVKKLKIPSETSVQLRFGAARHEVKITAIPQPGILRLNDSIAAKWGLYPGIPLYLQYKPSHRALYIGPLIGVMVSRVHLGSADNPFGPLTAFCREFEHACSVYGAAVFFFTPDELSAHADMLKGWQYTDGWEKRTFPVPHVIYNRLTSRKLENKVNVQEFLRHAKTKHHTIVFNERYLNKTEVFDALRNENDLQIYLPESYLLKDFKMLKTMCGKYSNVFLKPITGSLGKGIIRIKRLGQSYICQFTNPNDTRKQSFSSFAQLASALSGKLKRRHYQIQQGLSLISVEGRPVDFRALVQRNESGEWHITSIVARIAGNQHFVSNLARGGSLSTVKNALARSDSASGTGGAAKLRRAAMMVAKGIETHIPGHFAELGVDLALDIHGQIWLIEVNSKPSKDNNAPITGERKIRPSVKMLIQYCRFAAKF